MKKQHAKLIFDDDDGVGIVKFSPDFATEHWVTQADALTDWIHALQSEYERVLDIAYEVDLLERGDQ